MKYSVQILLFLFVSITSYGQNIELSENIGKINKDSKYKQFTKSIGEPDSIYHENGWHGKTKRYFKCFYTKYSLTLIFLPPQNKNLKSLILREVIIKNNSNLKLNGTSINKITPANMESLFGKPEKEFKSLEGTYKKYEFRRKKHFSILSIHFNPDGILIEINITFGKY